MTLYRKYRPQRFADLIGQKPVKGIIQNQIAHGKVGHAYLFAGPRGVGKTTMARLLAKGLNCERRLEGDWEPCNSCMSCLEIAQGTSLDIVEQDAASHRGIEEIRSLRENVRFSPSSAKYKIFIIDEVHMLTTPAFNALLKTLEEPPPQTVFILATTESYRLPETITSRCQRFDFKKVAKGEIVGALKKISEEERILINDQILDAIAIRAGGCMRDALTVLSQIAVLQIDSPGEEISWEQAEFVIPRSNFLLVERLIGEIEKHSAKGAFMVIEELMEEGVDLEQFMIDVLQMMRDKMREAVAGRNTAIYPYYRHILDVCMKRLSDIKRVDFLPQLPLELAVLECILEGDLGAGANGDIKNGAASVQEEDTVEMQRAVPIPNATTLASAVDIAAVEKKWPQVLMRIKEHNHTLPVALSWCKPLRIQNERLFLGFRYKLHQNKVMNDAKNRAILEGLLGELCGAPLMVEGEIVDGWEHQSGTQENENSQEDVLESVKEVFGS